MESDRPAFESHLSMVIWFWARVLIVSFSFVIGEMGLKPFHGAFLMIKLLKEEHAYEVLSSVPGML